MKLLDVKFNKRMPKTLLSIMFVLTLFALGASAVFAKGHVTDLPGKVDPGALEVAKKYLNGYEDGDKPLLRSLMAQKLRNFYGPCLFTKMPKLYNVRVDGARGMVDFDGEPIGVDDSGKPVFL